MIEILGKYSYLLYIFVGCIYFFKNPHKKLLLKLSLIAFPLSFIIGKTLNRIIINPRPFVIEHVQPLIPHVPDNGFPSDHTLLAATIASVVFVQNKKWGVILFVPAIVGGLARVLAKVHHTEDIVGSFAIAIAATYISTLLLKWANAHVAQKIHF